MAAHKPLLRIPYTDVFAAPRTVPRHATTPQAAAAALAAFVTAPPPAGLPAATVALTGAGLSVASGLADYRGEKGTYRVNKTYRPIYFHEFLASHEARKRYWARSFLGWTTLCNARPNASHYALRDLGRLGYVHSIITQNVDSFHRATHPDGPATVELHGYLRATVCSTCYREFPRDAFQDELARLNPAWAAFLRDAVASGVFQPENRSTGIRTNPDGDVDVPNAPYSTFRYPACSYCLANPPTAPDGRRLAVEVDLDGAWTGSERTNEAKEGVHQRGVGILKPAVVMFGESIAPAVKRAAEAAVDEAGRLLVLATSLATYSAWRLVKRAKDRGMPIAVVNMGGIRGEDVFFSNEVVNREQEGEEAVRVEVPTDTILPILVNRLKQSAAGGASSGSRDLSLGQANHAVFRDMLS